MQRTSSQRLLTIAAAGFIVFGVTAAVFSFIGSPDFMARPADELRYIVDNKTEAMIGGILAPIAAFFLLSFAGTLRAVLRERSPEDDHLASVAMAGGVAAAVALALALILNGAGAFRLDARDTVTAAEITALRDASDLVYGLLFPAGIGTMAAAVAWIGFRAAAVPRWFGWVSAVFAVAAIVPFVSWAVGLATPLWVIAVTLVLRRVPAGPAREIDLEQATTPAEPPRVTTTA